MFKILVTSVTSLALVCIANAAPSVKTAAPPPLQQKILNVFPQEGCGRSINLTLLSTEPAPNSKVEKGKLVSGEIRETWEATTCETHKLVRYLFRLAPNKKGDLEIKASEKVALPTK
jgi:hypothetical protein